MEVLEKVNEVVKLLDELDEYYDNLPTKQSNVDQKISDIYHYIENNTMNSKNSYRVVKELKNVLLERRAFKQEHSVLAVYNNNKNRLNLANNRKMLLAEVNKENKQQNTEYKYRVYDKEEFKDMMES